MAQIGVVKVETSGGPVELPVYDTGDSGSNVYEMWRVETASGPGFIPLVMTTDASRPYLRVQTANHCVLAAHDSTTSTGGLIDDFEDGTADTVAARWSDWAADFDVTLSSSQTLDSGNSMKIANDDGTSGSVDATIYRNSPTTTETDHSFSGYVRIDYDSGNSTYESDITFGDSDFNIILTVEFEDGGAVGLIHEDGSGNVQRTDLGSWSTDTTYYWEYIPNYSNNEVQFGYGTGGTIDTTQTVTVGSDDGGVYELQFTNHNDDSTTRNYYVDTLKEFC